MPNNQSGYSQAQILSMQQDAIRRVNEMQRISRDRVAGSMQPPPMNQNNNKTQQNQQRGSNQNFSQNNHKFNQNNKSDQLKENSIRKNESSNDNTELPFIGEGIDSLLKTLGIDKEQLLILVLLFLLINEGADQTMILALIYLLI